MNKPWKLIVLLTGIFLAGGVLGALFSMRLVRKNVANWPPPEQWATMHLKRVAKEMVLQPGQLEQIEPIVRERMEEIVKLRRRFLEENRTIRLLMEQEVAAKLTPEQRAIYERKNREFHERAQKMERGGRATRDK
jgi:biopolymer transport protein ExbB/TolQ